MLIEWGGYVGLALIVFAESGFLLGFFLPGDSLLFTAGLLSASGFFSPWLLVPMLIVCAIAGDSFGYWTGRTFGPKIFSREDSFFFHKKHVERTKVFYEKYGPKAILLARFVPIVRTFVPIFAGVGQMHYKTFISYNIIGGVLWAGGVTLLGYFLGASIPNIEKYLLPIILGIIFVSVLPILHEFYREWRNKKNHVV